MPSRGALIVVEGIDHSGKTTQCSMLVDALEKLGHNAMSMAFPDRQTHIGQILECYLLGQLELDAHTAHLLFAANRWEKASQVEKLLEQGTTIVMDRSSDSGVAYSVANGLDQGWCSNTDMGLWHPDIVFFLEVPPHVASKRDLFGLERYEHIEFQERVAMFFESKKHCFHTLSGVLGVRDVHAQILARTINLDCLKHTQK